LKKIPCLFVREFKNNYNDRSTPNVTITPVVTEGCEWVTAGEGRATRKWDGSACLVQDGKLWKRYDAKKGKTPPAGFLPAQPEPDPVTQHWPGWVPVVENDPASRWHWNAWRSLGATKKTNKPLEDGTYEICGPHFGDNNEKFIEDTFIIHGHWTIMGEPRTFEGLKSYLRTFPFEGIVFHHPDGRMAKIRRDDFGYPWPIPEVKVAPES
jgi:hypothetical protein